MGQTSNYKFFNKQLDMKLNVLTADISYSWLTVTKTSSLV